MFFSHRDFERKKQDLLQEFDRTPAHFLVGEERVGNQVQYQKILNSIIYDKKHRKCVKKQPKRLQSASSTKRSLKRFQKIKITQDDLGTGFYLTEAIGNKKLTNNQSICDEEGPSHQSKGQLDEEKETLIWLNVQAYEEKFKEVNYVTEINELEASIRWMKKRNNQIQEQLNRSNKKFIKFQNEGLKKQSILNSVTCRNKSIEQSIESTQRYFAKSLKNIECTKKSRSAKTAQMTDQLIQSLLLRDHRKIILQQQIQEFKNLQKKYEETKQKLKEFHNLLKKQTYFKNINSVIIFIKENSYGKIQKIKEHLKQNFQQNKQNQQEKVNFSKNARDFIRVFKKMKSDANRIESIYQQKMAEHKELSNIIKEFENTHKEKPMEKFIQQIGQQTKAEEEKIKIKNLKFIKNCQVLMSTEERCEFFIKKQIKCLQRVIENWLKFDQSAINFISNTMDSYINSEVKNREDKITFARIKDMLINSFENWQNYLGFIEQLDENPLLNRSLSKGKIYQFMRRIIKTKEYNPHISTESLFQCFLKAYYTEKVEQTLGKIIFLLKIGVKIYKYSSKYQVLIVNTCVKNQKQARQSTEGATNQNNFRNGEHQSQIPSSTNFKINSPYKEKPQVKLKRQEGQNMPKMTELIMGYQKQIKKVSQLKKLLGSD